MFAAIIAALTAFVELSKDVKLGINAWVKYKDEMWKNTLAEVQSKLLAGTMTVEEKKDAASKLADLISRIN